ncbi:metal ABC transporter ATP-binding protein [Nonomuraea longispora]|uniref:Metal ABC transporter ATP-binding protein n=2 Tax=Nonomuraea longispora TaxID=1848320 RepID=A0A4R4NB87_9ACTN|nr:metal ABC transporter ATP-binding protein [Nonomuraea longispora]
MMHGVAIHDVVAGYGRRVVLKGISAGLPESAVTAVVGPNGSGKSTLLGVLAGVVEPAGGRVEREGRRPGYVFQRSAAPDALPLTVRDTVAMGRWALRGPWRRLTAADRAVVDACMSRLGILDLAGRQLGALSGGQRQRALVAQGLAQEPGLLLLDEPATGLDVEAARLIGAVIDEESAAGVTVVHVTHDLAAAMAARHCLLLDGGRLVAQGPPGEVLTPQALRGVFGGRPQPVGPRDR